MAIKIKPCAAFSHFTPCFKLYVDVAKEITVYSLSCNNLMHLKTHSNVNVIPTSRWIGDIKFVRMYDVCNEFWCGRKIFGTGCLTHIYEFLFKTFQVFYQFINACQRIKFMHSTQTFFRKKTEKVETKQTSWYHGNSVDVRCIHIHV